MESREARIKFAKRGRGGWRQKKVVVAWLVFVLVTSGGR